MCFDFDAIPPDLPAGLAFGRAAGGAAAEIVELGSGDGTRFSAAFAGAADAKSPAVVIYPDVRGLYPFYIRLAERFADAGHHAVAIDYFGRTAGLGPRGEEFEYIEHVPKTRSSQIQADTDAAIAFVSDRTGEQRAATVGFCFGGGESFLAATNEDLDLAGAVGFYAGLDRSKWGLESPKDHATELRRPFLGLFGGADAGIPVELIEQFDRDLDESGRPHEIVIYPGAPHSFFDRRQDDYAEASEDAWRRTLDFLQTLE
ncbi:MAG: dienelactone hydrolase family protein [Thermoleophilaceae bacterium]